MTSANTLQIVVEVVTDKANASIRTVNTSFSKLGTDMAAQAAQGSLGMDKLTHSLTGGVLAMEKLQDKVFHLQAQMVLARQAVEANQAQQLALNAGLKTGTVNASDHAVQLRRLQVQEGSLAKAQQEATFHHRTAAAEYRNLSAVQRDAAGDANLLLTMVGVRLPAGFDMLLTRMGPVQRAIGAALPVGIVVAAAVAIGTALAELYVHWDSLGSKVDEVRGKIQRYGLLGAYTGVQGAAEEAIRESAFRSHGESNVRTLATIKATKLLGLTPLEAITERDRQEREKIIRSGGVIGAAETAARDKELRRQQSLANLEYRLSIEETVRGVSRAWLGEVDALRQAATDEIAIRKMQVGLGKQFSAEEEKAIRDRSDFAIAMRNRQLDNELLAARGKSVV